MTHKHWMLLGTAILISGCAFRPQVQRFGVEYNEALASMANEQTVLNVLRASKGMPTHFTSVSRFTGTLSMRASGSMNGQIRGSGATTTSSSGTSLSTATTAGTSAAPGGLTTTNSVLTTPGSTSSLVGAVAEGVDLYTPQIGGELSSGTAFDVQVFDQQKFYQGILSSVPIQTVEMLINQGFEPDLIAHLLIARVDFYREDPATPGKKFGDAVASYRNDATDRARFQRLIDCNALEVAAVQAPTAKIVPISRLDIGTAAGTNRLTLEQLALFDGEKFALSEVDGIGPDEKTDAKVYVVKPGAKGRAPKLRKRSCEGLPPIVVPEPYLPQAVYLGENEAMVEDKENGVHERVKEPVITEVVFRSPEGVLRAVGELVRREGQEGVPTLAICPKGGTECKGSEKKPQPIFELTQRRDRSALIEVRFMGADYSIPQHGFRSMQVISIIQQLINLQKESSERALSIPVRAVP